MGSNVFEVKYATVSMDGSSQTCFLLYHINFYFY